MNESTTWLWMREIFGIATARAHTALERYKCPQALLNLSISDIAGDTFLTDEERRCIAKPDFSAAERQVSEAISQNIEVLTFHHADYPERLRHIFSPPMVLFAKGSTALLGMDSAVAMVGSREPDGYGLRCAYTLSGQVAKGGGVVVSGLARGIDAACHKGALDVGGKTIALLAAGMDVDYPAENRALRARIEEHGLILTEYPLKTRALPHHFVVRNRIVSGISRAVVVVQALTRSGSMNTASHAAEQGRDVFAVPGDIFNRKMEGCHTLLSEGAAPALSGGMILGQIFPEQELLGENNTSTELSDENLLSLSSLEGTSDLTADPIGKIVYQALCEKPLGLDELLTLTGCAASDMLGILTEMEIFGRVEPLPGGKYQAR
jgi:DNA processing protein